jgi:hypothetical protein
MEEVLPLLFCATKFGSNQEINRMDDFLLFDPERTLLKESHLPTVMMITRLYLQDTKRYLRQADYWL